MNPVAQMTFDEEEFHGGAAPPMSDSSLLRVQVDMPHVQGNSFSIKEKVTSGSILILISVENQIVMATPPPPPLEFWTAPITF